MRCLDLVYHTAFPKKVEQLAIILGVSVRDKNEIIFSFLL